MKSTSPNPNLDRIRIQLRRIEIAGHQYVKEALIAGQMLLEDRRDMMTSQRGKSAWTDRTKPAEDQFAPVIATLGIKRSRAYRWMDAADRVARAVWPDRDIGLIDRHTVEIEGDEVPVSRLLTTPDEESTEAQRTARSRYFGLISGKTINDCLSGIIIDGDEAHSLTRAHNGGEYGGFNGEDRKDWPVFVARKFSQMATHLSHWETMTEVQKMEVKQILHSAVVGGEVHLAGGKPGEQRGKFHYEAPLPRDCAEFLHEAIKERLRATK